MYAGSFIVRIAVLAPPGKPQLCLPTGLFNTGTECRQPQRIGGDCKNCRITSRAISCVILWLLSQLGATFGPLAHVLTADTKTAVPVALLERLAKGTVIGVDAILERFGERARI